MSPDPQLVRAFGNELAFHQISGPLGLGFRPCGPRRFGSLHALEALGFHDAFDDAAGGLVAFSSQFGPYLSCSVHVVNDYLDPSLPIDRRVDDLLGRMSIAEKAALKPESLYDKGCDILNKLAPRLPTSAQKGLLQGAWDKQLG